MQWVGLPPWLESPRQSGLLSPLVATYLSYARLLPHECHAHGIKCVVCVHIWVCLCTNLFNVLAEHVACARVRACAKR